VSVTVTVPATRRTGRGKNENNRVRAAGKLPAVLYGSNKDPLAISINPRDIEKVFRSKFGYNTIIELDVDGVEKEPSMIVDWQLHPVRDTILHVDFKRIDMTKRVAVNLPVNLTGVPFGIKNQGGTLDTVVRAVAVECLPGEIPEAIDANISGLKLGDALRAGELKLPEGMVLLTRATQVVAQIAGTRASALAEKEKKEGEEAAD
jgi:large subunit ribosomal protein L25